MSLLPPPAETPLFKAYKIFTMIIHILDHKASLNKFKEFKSYKVCSLTTMQLN